MRIARRLVLLGAMIVAPIGALAQVTQNGLLIVTGHGNDPFVHGKQYRYQSPKTGFSVVAFGNGIQTDIFPSHIDIIADQDLLNGVPGLRIFFQAADGGYLGVGTYLNATEFPSPDPGTPGLAWSGGCALNGGTMTGTFRITGARYERRTNGSFNVLSFVITFTMACPVGAPGTSVTGSFTYTGIHEKGTTPFDPGTLPSGTGSGTGTPTPTPNPNPSPTPTPTPTPQPVPTIPIVILPDDLRAAPIVMANGASTTALFSTFVPDTTVGNVTLSASSDADNLLVSVAPSVLKTSGTLDSVLTIKTTPTTAAGNHAVTITATAPDGSSSSATVFVTVLCDPPFILGIDQPKSSTVSSGRPAQLSVKAAGSGPFTYQWFTGASGLSNFPLAGGTSANFTTSALNDTTSYWVRVTNPCGSVDSQTATVNVSASAKPSGRR
jgi:hypothetical protein